MKKEKMVNVPETEYRKSKRTRQILLKVKKQVTILQKYVAAVKE